MKIDLKKLLDISNSELIKVINREPEADRILFETNWFYGSVGFYMQPISKPETKMSFSKMFYQDGTPIPKVEYAGMLVNKTCFIFNLGIIENYPELLDFFREGYLTKKYNQIDIVVEDKKFVSYTPVWNQAVVDDFYKKQNKSQPYRAKYNAKFKPWYLDKGNYTEIPVEGVAIPDAVVIDSFTSLTKYLKSIAASNKQNWDCTFLTFQVTDFSSLYSLVKEEYVYHDDQDPEREKPHAFIQEIKFSAEDFKKIFTGFKTANLWDAYTIEFQLKADGTFDYYVLDGYKKWINGRDVNPKSFEEFEKEMETAEADDLKASEEPITSDYLLQNIYGCISANVPDGFASIEAVITRSFNGDTQQLSGSYSYKPTGLFSSSKSVEPGEQIYPLNVTVRLLDEFYTEQSKDWRKAVLTFKSDGTCNVKIGK